MMYFLKLGLVNVQIENWASMPLWDVLKWKLDQFSDNGLGESNIDTKISYDISTENSIGEEKLELLVKREKGFFDWVAKKSKEEVYYDLIRRTTGTTYLQYCVRNNWKKIAVLIDKTNSGGQIAFEYLGQIMPGVFLHHRMLTFHGVLLENEGYGIIVSAPSGTGKTTHARLWRDNRHALIINGDIAACRKVDGVWTGFGLPWSGTSGEQINRSVPIKAMVVLERSESNQAFQIGELDAFGALLPNILCPAWDADLTGKVMDLLNDFLQEIPVIRLQCRPDLESLEVLSKVLEDL